MESPVNRSLNLSSIAGVLVVKKTAIYWGFRRLHVPARYRVNRYLRPVLSIAGLPDSMLRSRP